MLAHSALSRGLDGIDAAVLAGGLGTRLKGAIGDQPKILAPVAGRPFLDHLIDYLFDFGNLRLVLCLGYRADSVLAHLARRPSGPVTVCPVIEPEPLGTAGALRFARPHLRTDPVLVLNGDTFVDADLAGFADRHRESGASLSLLCVEVEDAARYGRIERDMQGFVSGFVEKDPNHQGKGLISAGFYLFSAAFLDQLTNFPGSSLERDLFQRLPSGTIRTEVARGGFIDIGTPESFARATHAGLRTMTR